jgi:hypothetical protein
VAQLLEMEPHFRISEWVAHTGQRQAHMYIDGLRNRISRVTHRPVAPHQRFDRVGRDRDFREWQILLKKSFRGGERKFLEQLMRVTRGDVRDHIASSKIDHGAP